MTYAEKHARAELRIIRRGNRRFWRAISRKMKTIGRLERKLAMFDGGVQ